MNTEQRLQYAQDYSFTMSSEWKTSDEYAEYLKAADARSQREREWKNYRKLSINMTNVLIFKVFKSVW